MRTATESNQFMIKLFSTAGEHDTELSKRWDSASRGPDRPYPFFDSPIAYQPGLSARSGYRNETKSPIVFVWKLCEKLFSHIELMDYTAQIIRSTGITRIVWRRQTRVIFTITVWVLFYLIIQLIKYLSLIIRACVIITYRKMCNNSYTTVVSVCQ